MSEKKKTFFSKKCAINLLFKMKKIYLDSTYVINVSYLLCNLSCHNIYKQVKLSNFKVIKLYASMFKIQI